jgi:hypothetical protein
MEEFFNFIIKDENTFIKNSKFCIYVGNWRPCRSTTATPSLRIQNFAFTLETGVPAVPPQQPATCNE